jgi:hypothetical protein
MNSTRIDDGNPIGSSLWKQAADQIDSDDIAKIL